jgi:molybdopterin converting factor small subunit
MKIKVMVAVGDLVTHLGYEIIVELKTNAKLKDLLSKLTEKIGSSRKGFLGHYDVVGVDLVVLVNGFNIHALKGLETSLRDGDIVAILPLSSGG